MVAYAKKKFKRKKNQLILFSSFTSKLSWRKRKLNHRRRECDGVAMAPAEAGGGPATVKAYSHEEPGEGRERGRGERGGKIGVFL